MIPNTTTVILAEHKDEIWSIAWSNDGGYLATGSGDKTAIIWRVGSSDPPTGRECILKHILKDHTGPVTGLTWSPDDKTLLTCVEDVIRVWDVQTATCMKELTGHIDMIAAVEWYESGFMSAGMDCRIISWDNQFQKVDTWSNLPIRITDIAMDSLRIIAVGVAREPTSTNDTSDSDPASLIKHLDLNERAPKVAKVLPRVFGPLELHGFDDEEDYRPVSPVQNWVFENRMLIWNPGEMRLEGDISLKNGDVTSVKISRDSRFALVGNGPNVHLALYKRIPVIVSTGR
ncbi:hypothetical protein M422DRAFT_70421 [Sphaerobolus stellatus SS14]|uniref:Uncharacterized protein n=1 Tax=Sphaerobolus stellatus (strain SS14) TaxID=990650 RepID=A0A0C9V6T4_SPHS4|nr:hypothetical protein M422DRAFT_70421 [Sphaerobolus stellatus SS14]